MDKTPPSLEGYRECHLCTVERKTLERRCHYCTGKLSLRDRLHLTIERRWRRKVSPYLSAIMPGLGHWFRGRRYVGTFFFSLVPLAAGLVLATYRGWNWGLSLLALGCAAVWITALIDAARGPSEYDPPCEDACPAGLPCSRYVHLLAEGKAAEAFELILTRCPFPGTIGRVCHHPCEQSCNRAKDGEPVSICALKRFADDRAGGEGNLFLREMKNYPASVDRKVAVVGAGPAGLSAALFLRLLGFQVTLFESRQEPGGTPLFFLAPYRLPADVYPREVARILELGIELRTGQELGKEFSIEDLHKQGFHGVFLGLGAMRSIRLPHTGREEEGYIDGRAFLEKAISPERFRLHGNVLVIGGGNVAVDVARTALRCGAGKVRMMCLETSETMPAHAWEIAEAVREGVELYPAGATVSFEHRNERVCIANCRKVERIDKEPGGRLKPVLATGDGFDLESDWIITAVGSAPDWSFLGQKGRPPMVPLHGKIPVALLDRPGAPAMPVVVGGDMVKGPASVIEAIAAGREAALHLYRSLVGSPPISILFRNRVLLPPFPNYSDCPEKRRRLGQIEIDARGRETFEEVYRGFAEGTAREEADRCIRCDWPLISEKKARKKGWIPSA